MIITPFVNFAYFLINGFISWFPQGSGLPQEVHDASIWLGGYLALINDLVPVAVLATVTGTVFLVEITLYGFRTLKWVFSHVPQIGGRG